jgi:hypothetical protein
VSRRVLLASLSGLSLPLLSLVRKVVTNMWMLVRVRVCVCVCVCVRVRVYVYAGLSLPLHGGSGGDEHAMPGSSGGPRQLARRSRQRSRQLLFDGPREPLLSHVSPSSCSGFRV